MTSPASDSAENSTTAQVTPSGGSPQNFAGTGGPVVNYTPNVVRTGGEILVNSAIQNAQIVAQITTLSNGGFVVTWQDDSRGVGGTNGDYSSYAIKVQIFTDTGEIVERELIANAATTNSQDSPKITALSDGGFVVVWRDSSQGVGGATGDTSSYAVKAMIFTATGARPYSEILVNTATLNGQDAAQITALSNGGFVVTWQDRSLGVGGSTGDSSGSAIKVQVFTASGSKSGGEVLVNTATSGDQISPQITSLPNGNFVVTWEDRSQGVGGATGDNVFGAVKAQVFTAAGAKAGGEILVNTATANNQGIPEIIVLQAGGFVIAWQDYSEGVGGATGDSTGYAVKAQVFTAGGARTGGEILVNTATAADQIGARMTSLSDGGFVVTWNDRSGGVGGATGDTSSYALKAQVFTATGTPVGSEILVNSATSGSQGAQAITALSNGGFAITWDDASRGVGGATGDTSSTAIKAQVFGADGAKVGGEILVNTATANSQTSPDITALANGGFVVTWQDLSLGVGGATGDNSNNAIKAQVYNVGPNAVEKVPLDLKSSGFSVSDPDAADILTVTLSTDYGVLTATAGGSGTMVSGSGTATLTLTGTASQIDALLNGDATSTVRFVANTNSPPATATLTLTADDGAGGVASSAMILPIEDTAGIVGASGHDKLTGTAGNDALDGADGNDRLEGGAGSDALTGGDGNDYLDGGTGADAMSGGTGNDVYYVDDAGDTTTENGGEGYDIVRASISWTLGANIEGLQLQGAGDIDGTGNALANNIQGNSGKNVLHGGDGTDTIDGGDGNDQVFGDAGGDILRGGLGNDIVDGGDGGDSLDGGDGNDKLYGGSGNDSLTGGAGADQMYGGSDNDLLVGGEGNDLLDGGTGNDAMTGGLGNDVYYVDSQFDTTVEALNEGYDIIRSSVNWTLGANIEGLELQGSANINGTGNALANTIVGNSGANTLSGGGGVDTIDGGDGADRIIGGTGNDLLTGGLGADTFVVLQESIGNPTVEVDNIFDFSTAQGDTLDLSSIDADSLTAGDQAFTLVGAFTHAAGQMTLSFSGGQTLLRLDVNGDGTADYQLKINGDVTGDSGGWLL